MNTPVEKLEKIKVTIKVEVEDVKYLVSLASVEAMEQHLEVLTVNEDVRDCVICMETIQVGLDLVGRMPCQHVFHHRPCIEWLEETGICPLYRDVFPV